MQSIQSIIGQVSGGTSLSSSQMQLVVDQIMQGAWQDEQIGLFLMALRAKGETVDEVVGAARSLREHMTRLDCSLETFVDTCGTGGDGAGTFNISTAAAIVTAAAGIRVVKHGNRKVTSKSGSSDVLAELGVNIDATVDQVQACIQSAGIGFCFAPLMHRSMKQVAEVRRQLGVPTIFNILGPLCNPASAPHQVLGVGRPELRPLIADALWALGTTRSVVVCGEDGLDEVTLGGVTYVSVVSTTGSEEHRWSPADFGLQAADKSELVVDGTLASADCIRRILDGERGPHRDIVVINAAAALWVAGFAENLLDCSGQAAQAIDSGAASQALARLAKISHS